MSKLVFNRDGVAKLLDELKQATSYSVTMDDLFDPDLYPNGEPLDKNGKTESEVEAAGGHFWPSADHIDRSKLGPKLQLVGDHGVYLITNADLPGTPSERGTVVYAEKCDPSKDDDWDDNKRRLFGGDDGGTTLPVEWGERVIENNLSSLQIRVTLSSINLVMNRK